MVRRMPSISRSGFTDVADLLDGVDQRREPLERVVLALHRHQHAVGGHQGVDRQHVQRRRAVDEDHVVVVAHRLQRHGAAAARGRRSSSAAAPRRRSGPGWRAAARSRAPAACSDAPRRAVQSPTSTSQLPCSSVRLLDAAAHGGVALRVEVHQQHAAPRRRQRGGEVDGSGGLADPALLVGDGDHAFHGRDRSGERPVGMEGFSLTHAPAGLDA